MTRRSVLVALMVATFVVVGVFLQSSSRRDADDIASRKATPEAASGWTEKSLVRAGRHMIVAANPLASEAGLEILRAGGSAMDATIAAQLVLNLVEPQSSGIGGGAFLLHWDAAGKRLVSYDARETAPAAALPDRFIPKDGSEPQWHSTVHSGLSVGVPGLVRGLELAHRAHGKLPWPRLFERAIQLSQDGFAVSPRLSAMLADMGAENFGPTARSLYFDAAGVALPVGHVLKNPEFAETLKAIATQGSKAFYGGAIPEAIVAKLAGAPNAPGDMTVEDISSYRALSRAPICARYRGYRVCGMGPPSSGALTVGQVLKLVEPFDLGTLPAKTEALHILGEAQKLAFADRGRYMADHDYVTVPKGLLDDGYLAERRRLIQSDTAMTKAEPGQPPQRFGQMFGRDGSLERAGTSHISVVDGAGNAVSMTTTIESAFGSRLMVGGFLLNNELTDFAWRPEDALGRPVANRVEAGKRPRSSMSPTIVFAPNGKLWAVTGSPGGSRIINYTLKTIIGMIDWKLDAQAAADLVNFGSRNGPFEVESGPAGLALAEGLKGKGQTVVSKPMTSGVHTIVVTDRGLEGGADPRREGVALGD